MESEYSLQCRGLWEDPSLRTEVELWIVVPVDLIYSSYYMLIGVRLPSSSSLFVSVIERLLS